MRPSDALSSLGMSPLGGVESEVGPLPSSTVQVALSVPATPVSSGLVSLITLTQVISTNREGEGIEAGESPRSADRRDDVTRHPHARPCLPRPPSRSIRVRLPGCPSRSSLLRSRLLASSDLVPTRSRNPAECSSEAVDGPSRAEHAWPGSGWRAW